MIRSFYLSFSALVMAGCTHTTIVRHTNPPPPHPIPPEIPQDEESSSAQVKSRPLESLGYSLTAARILQQKLTQGDRSPETLGAYNYAVARTVEAIDQSNIDPWSSRVTIPSNGGTFSLDATLARKEPRFHPVNYRMLPTDIFRVSGTYFQHLQTQSGIGAPIAIVAKHPNRSRKHDLDESVIYGSATATLTFTGNQAHLQVHESLRMDTITLNGRNYPLAADFSTPVALLLDSQHIESLGLRRLINPDRYADTARLTRLQLYDGERIPIVLVHGLDSTPATWTPLINAIRADPVLRKRYQIWVFSYPSGYPYPYSAALLRRELDHIHHRFPDHKPIVMIGHSMGGMISRLMLTDSGDSIWRSYFGHSPAQTKIPGMYRKRLEEALIFQHRSDISRTIFISTPHRGSEIAITSFGRVFSKLVHVPDFVADTRNAVFSLVTLDATALTLDRAPSSIDTLAPNNRFVLAVNKLPLAKGIPYHSIIGDRGRGNTPHSSDGVVPYWSSHMDDAASEKIVPSNHGAHQNPEAILEVERILKLHAGLSSR